MRPMQCKINVKSEKGSFAGEKKKVKEKEHW